MPAEADPAPGTGRLPPGPAGTALRRGRSGDAQVLAALHRRARAEAMPWLAVVHDPVETVQWMAGVVLVQQQVWVAERAEQVLGFSAVHGDWLEQLYVTPEAQGQGVGRALLRAAQAACPDGLQLWVFTRNERARRFYESAGFVLAEQTEGADNEEREPDCRYVWRSPSPSPN